MKASSSSVFDILSRLRVNFLADSPTSKLNSEAPLRSELFNSDQMDNHGKVVASTHKLQSGQPTDRLLKRLEDNEKVLLEVRNLFVDSIRGGKAITPGAEWLLDNFYLIEEQVVIARKHLPKGYSEGLPYLESGNSAGMPRVYDIVLEIISHSDGRVDIKSLSSFIESYQTAKVLTLGELWAIPIMLRLAVIENLRRVSVQIAINMIDRNLSDYWADKMMAVLQEQPGDLILVIADMARSKPELNGSFVAGFTRKLQGKGPALSMPLNWLEQQLSGTGVSSSDLIREENQVQAADQVSVRNSIGTLRFLGATDWREFVETLSRVEQVLRQDVTGVYPLMDFTTRDRYRHTIESISKASLLSEAEVATKVLELTAKHSNFDGNLERHEHIGYYLVDKGLREAEKACGMRRTLGQKLAHAAGRMPVFLYLFAIVAVTVLCAAGMYSVAYAYGSHNTWLLFLVAILSLSGAAQLAVSLVNLAAGLWIRPSFLPRMDFSKGIPAEYRTLVVIPTMLSDAAYIEELIDALEVRFLANKEANLHFGLLSDFVDANAENLPGDAALVEKAAAMINTLNEKYSEPDNEIFYLFHRPRTWNAGEQKWMGYERKRGKLSALNALLRSRDKKEFSLVIGNQELLTNVKYVITLDSDTELPRDSAWKFVATMAHPLNQAVYDLKKHRVTEGYGILQPRVGSGFPKSFTSLYLRMQGDVAGIDPYTRVSSDVYQDLFGEGSFIGKGIYDVDIFEKALNDVFQENRILSHDLLEGCYTRSGLVSDVQLHEQNPSSYEGDVRRRHRWIRGDWQIGAWMLPLISGSDGRLKSNKLSALSRWKIFDNLRRSVLPVSLMLLLLSGWTILPMHWFWTLAVTIIILLPVMVAAGWQLMNKAIDLTLKAHLSEVGRSVRDTLIRFVFGIAVLPYEAYRFTHAIFITNWRMVISHKKMLQWTPSASSSSTTNPFWATYRNMWIAPALAIACTLFFFQYNPHAFLVASPMLILWLLAPALAWRISMPEKEEDHLLEEDQLLFLHKSARKTWSFFEEFVTAEENWLPPDNFQEQPVAVIAHRTSPTNLGLSLLANLSAYDFGYIPMGQFLDRTKSALETMLQMERYRGHFYNWYDTITLLPLHPRYVSTVDSGNLVGHLLTLKQGLLGLSHQPVFNHEAYQGLYATAAIAIDESKNDHAELREIQGILQAAIADNSISLLATKQNLERLTAIATGAIERERDAQSDLNRWLNKLRLQLTAILDDLNKQIPWLVLLPVPERFARLAAVDHIPSVSSMQQLPDIFSQSLTEYDTQENTDGGREWLFNVRAALAQGSELARRVSELNENLADQCEELSNVEYGFLFNKSTSLLRIGYNVDDQRADESYYDLLASEARLGIFVGIAQGKVPQESWFALGRLLTNSGGDPILLSWSGSMFEYLMPQLVMPTYENTLLYQTNKATVKRQIEYASKRGVPWGISESGYNMVDASLNYQYRAFGVPGLGLKRGLEEDLVIAPYASMMALMVAPGKACANLQLLSAEGFEGHYGYYEAIDYTPSRLPRGKTNNIIQSYMVHHQGMGFLSLAYLLLNKPMQRRFVSELRFQATLLLLQERIPRTTLFYAHTADLVEINNNRPDVQVRQINTANTAMPEIQLLSNGRYQVMISNSGGGYSRWKDLAVTRWREDGTKDNTGIFCYIKDIGSGEFWSNTYQPTLKAGKEYEAIFSQGHVEFRRNDFGIETKTEIVISPEDDTEMRRLKICNKTSALKVLEITSYAEVVMASHASDEAHPAFSNLFVQTEIKAEYNAVFSTRRPRSEHETPPWMFHLMEVTGAAAEAVSYETDRMQFIGRGRTLVNPLAMESETLSGKDGAVLDPIMSIRYRVVLKPNQTATIDLIYGITDNVESCEALMQKYRDRNLKKRAFELSWTHSQVLLRQINATEADAQLYGRLAASVIFSNPRLRADPFVISSNLRGQSSLWSHSVSGDLPIVLLHIYEPENIQIVKEMMQAHAYWRLKGLAVDLVIWNEDHGSYRQVLQEQILGLISVDVSHGMSYSKPGNIFVRSADQISTEDRILFESIARVIISDNKGTLAEQINSHVSEKASPALLEPKSVDLKQYEIPPAVPADLVFYNGTGGFSPDGREYKIITGIGHTTPAPWANVLANPNFGTVISESGSAYTWALNAHEYRLTPWSNDPVSDAGGEAFYLRDEETGSFWSPSPFPAMSANQYVTTHGFGYSTFKHSVFGIKSTMSVFVDLNLPVKFIVIKLRNISGRPRKISATGFMDIILGDVRSKTNMHIVSEQDEGTGALLLRNSYNTAFADRVAFFKVSGGTNYSYTTDRTEFIGRNGNLQNPRALYRKKLSGRSGAGMDPCAALQVNFDLLDGQEKEIVFILGNEENAVAAIELARRVTEANAVNESLASVKAYWEEVLGTVQVSTPDPALDILTNGWLIYQTIASRIFARSGFYQSGGAFGFRDQLQDVIALLPVRPAMAREQILLNASRQFIEGDVQHWWHPPEGRGVRTNCSDDLLWLPFAVSRYVSATGDRDILTTEITFLESRMLHDGEDSLYDLFLNSNQTSSLYDHCKRAIAYSQKYGVHNLPLIGAGDWNDGMDLVGHKGRGESVWLAFFLYDVLMRFADVASVFNDEAFSEQCRADAAVLQENIEAAAWDGEWYKRAWFDDGTALGSKDNAECRIDAIAQSWSILSSAASGERRLTALASLDKLLVNRELKLIQLLDPPFDKDGPNPGYIKGYVPGVRENGGQYSHAAIWALMAFAKMGQREKLWELFSMVQPLSHASDPAEVQVYKVEPYVMAADVYANESHKGRGGWTWYTGSAGWMYQFVLGSLLGMEVADGHLIFKPCFPVEWPSVKINYRHRNSVYNLTVFQLKGSEAYWQEGNIRSEGNVIELTEGTHVRNISVFVGTG
ncbi:MAG: glycosyltransferase 36 [Sphingobacteriaceae bacterium]|jgi:cellobiose phosphorylase|nr:glycosyltransferase 36 [Sphingobacteriaceae bacterium]